MCLLAVFPCSSFEYFYIKIVVKRHTSLKLAAIKSQVTPWHSSISTEESLLSISFRFNLLLKQVYWKMDQWCFIWNFRGKLESLGNPLYRELIVSCAKKYTLFTLSVLDWNWGSCGESFKMIPWHEPPLLASSSPVPKMVCSSTATVVQNSSKTICTIINYWIGRSKRFTFELVRL